MCKIHTISYIIIHKGHAQVAEAAPALGHDERPRKGEVAHARRRHAHDGDREGKGRSGRRVEAEQRRQCAWAEAEGQDEDGGDADEVRARATGKSKGAEAMDDHAPPSECPVMYSLYCFRSGLSFSSCSMCAN